MLESDRKTQMSDSESMQAILLDEFGDIDSIRMGTHPKPILQEGQGDMLIKVLACSVSPGDIRTIDGTIDILRTPPSWPCVPGHDVCGIIEQLDETDEDAVEHFSVGDCIVSTSPGINLLGGLAEYALVKSAPASIKPDAISAIEGAGLPSSAQRAVQGARQANVHEGQRVLVLGASGGFGTYLIQMLRNDGAYIVATSTQHDLVKSLGADKACLYFQTQAKGTTLFTCN